MLYALCFMLAISFFTDEGLIYKKISNYLHNQKKKDFCANQQIKKEKRSYNYFG